MIVSGHLRRIAPKRPDKQLHPFQTCYLIAQAQVQAPALQRLRALREPQRAQAIVE
jgi:hypothetical protein